LTAEKYRDGSLTAGIVMEILAALKAEESKLQQQLNTVRAAMKLVKKKKVSAKRKKATSEEPSSEPSTE
jgi:hypothetical protein